MKYRYILVAKLLFLFSSNGYASTPPWGFNAHKMINRYATFCLPTSLLSFYKPHIEYVTAHAIDPDKRRYINSEEAARHYMDIEFYENIDSIPRIYEKAIAKYSIDSLTKHGIVPWHIQKMKYQLQKAFEEKNIALILKYSADIGHYIADAHVPLHTTKNYNGQLTNQHGIHSLWESRIIDLFSSEYNYFTGKAMYISNISQTVWNTIKETNQLVDSVLLIEKDISIMIPEKYAFENKGSSISKVYSNAYTKAYHERLNGMVEKQMKKAILSISSIWYTSWIDAGQPDLSNTKFDPPKEEEKETTDCPHNNCSNICD